MPAPRRSPSAALALALALVLGLPLASTAQAVAKQAAPEEAPLATFKAPVHSPTGETIILDARGSKSDAPLEWFVDGPKGIEKTAPDAKNEIGLIVDPIAGTYRVFLIAFAPSGKKHMAARTIEVGATPPPPPTVVKPPIPAPKAVLKAPSHLTPGSHIVLDASKSHSAGPIIWKVEGRRDLVASFSPDPKDGPPASLAVIFNAPAGDYAVTATAVGEGGAEDKTEPFVIHVSETGPLTPDLVDPKPTTGYTGQINAVLLVDLQDVPASHTSVIARDNVDPYLKAGDFTYQIMDVRSPSFAGSVFTYYLNGCVDTAGKVWPKVAAPALLLYGQDGSVLACDPAPGTPRGVAAKIREVRMKVGAGG